MKNIRKKTFALGSIGSIVFLLFLFLAIYPLSQNIKKINQALLNKKNTLLNIKNLMGKVSLQNDAERIEKSIKKVDSIIIKKDQKLAFIKQLEAIADNLKIEQKINLRRDEEPESQNGVINQFNTLPIEITLRGDFQSLLKYVLELEKSDYYVNIKKIQIGKFESNLGELSLPSEAVSLTQPLILFISGETYWEL